MRFSVGWKVLLGAVLWVLAARTARAGDVIAEISVRNTQRPSTFHGEVFVFPENVRDYSRTSFYGWSFRNRLPSGAVRMLEVDRARTPGAYLFATDLFANGRFSTMSHTVLMVFPRNPVGRSDLYALREDGLGHLQIFGPDGSVVLIDGESGAVLPSASFLLAPLGDPGTPPRVRHRGMHLEIHAVGKSPFLHGTPVAIADTFGGSCELTTDEVFVYGNGPESDVFRFDSDAELFRYLDRRCPQIRPPRGDWRTAAVVPAVEQASATLVSATARIDEGKSSRNGGLLDSLLRLFSR